MHPSIAVVLPALNEERSVECVVDGFRALGMRVVVVDNGSNDATSSRALQAGAEVVREPRRGYGSACLAGIAHLAANGPPTILVFSDSDGTLFPGDAVHLVGSLKNARADLALGRRIPVESGAMSPGQRLGNRLLLRLLHSLFGLDLHDLSSFRAISWTRLERLDLRETTFGFPMEIIVRAVQSGARIVEVPVRIRRREFGRSKVAGNVVGVVRAASSLALLGVRLRLA